MKHTGLEDGGQLVTRLELREMILSLDEKILLIHKDMLEIKKEISDIRDTIRNRWWIPIAVAVAAMAGNTIAAFLLRHV